jgi:hypothetical protein
MEAQSTPDPAQALAQIPAESEESIDIPHPFLRVTDPKKRAYLLAQSVTPSERMACQIADVSTKSIWNWKTKARNTPNDPESIAFLEAYAAAKEMAIESAEHEAWERATTGWQEPVFGNVQEPVEIDGKNGPRIVYRNVTSVVGHITKKSDTMLIFMLKGAKPETYRDNVHHSGSVGLTLQITLPDNGRPVRDVIDAEVA